MYSKTLKPEIMRTMLPEGFPGRQAEQAAVRGHRRARRHDPHARRHPDRGQHLDSRTSPAGIPAIHAADSYQKDLDHLPQLPIFHMRETNDIDYFVSRGYVFVHTDSRGTGHSPTGQWDLFGQEMQNDLYDMTEWIAVQDWCDGKVGMLGESLLAWSQWFCAVQQPPHLTCILPWDAGADLYRDVAWHGGMMAVGFPTAWNMWEIRGPLPPGHPRAFRHSRAQPRDGQMGHGVEHHQPSHLRRLLEAAQSRLQEDPVPRLRGRRAAQGRPAPARRGARLRRSGDAQEDDAHPRPSWTATRWPSTTRPRCGCSCCAGTTTGSRATTPASWTSRR